MVLIETGATPPRIHPMTTRCFAAPTASRLLLLICSILLVICGLSGCSMARYTTLSENLRDLDSRVALIGWVPIADPGLASLRVMALGAGDIGNPAHQITSVSEAGLFFFRTAAGSQVIVVAFEDRNSNGVLDDGERWSARGPVTPLAGATTLAVGLMPELTAAAVPIAWSTHFRQTAATRTAGIALGEITTFSDVRLSLQVGTQGLWAPSDFINHQGMGVFLLRAHVASKTPVVFIAGAGGAPVEWRQLIDSLDQERFEPWLFLYPSGLRLEDSARALCGIVGHLQQRLAVKRVDFVAHSMGGLVARECLRQSKEPAATELRVRHLITLATPWGGHEAAHLGVKYAPAAVPAWNDLVPDSPFLRRLLRTPLPTGTSFTLLYASRGTGSETGGDGIVSAASARNSAAVHEAQRVAGFRADHGSILVSLPAIDAVRSVLLSP
jgi:pimeloyl-ACP methyl ester carboxylesterase